MKAMSSAAICSSVAGPTPSAGVSQHRLSRRINRTPSPVPLRSTSTLPSDDTFTTSRSTGTSTSSIDLNRARVTAGAATGVHVREHATPPYSSAAPTFCATPRLNLIARALIANNCCAKPPRKYSSQGVYSPARSALRSAA